MYIETTVMQQKNGTVHSNLLTMNSSQQKNNAENMCLSDTYLPGMLHLPLLNGEF